MITIVRETHEAPASIAERLQIAGGSNRYNEANYRVIWGWNRLTWIGGKFEDRDAEGELVREVVELRQEPKYPQVNRWHVERWVPPEAYGSAKSWYGQTIERANGQSIPSLGPYPERGEYEHCFTVETAAGEFLPLTCSIVEQVARAVEYSRSLPKLKTRASLYEREARNEKSYDAWALEQLSQDMPRFL
jgi:hypothetical protein